MHDLRKYIHVLETYQEEASIFSNNGVMHDLNQIFVMTEFLPIAYVSTQDLLWMLAGYDPTPDDMPRMDAADLAVPILVTVYEGNKWLIVDGFHRLLKAIREKVSILPCKIVTSTMLRSSMIQ
jgi:hypothetical protein